MVDTRGVVFNEESKCPFLYSQPNVWMLKRARQMILVQSAQCLDVKACKADDSCTVSPMFGC